MNLPIVQPSGLLTIDPDGNRLTLAVGLQTNPHAWPLGPFDRDARGTVILMEAHAHLGRIQLRGAEGKPGGHQRQPTDHSQGADVGAHGITCSPRDTREMCGFRPAQVGQALFSSSARSSGVSCDSACSTTSTPVSFAQPCSSRLVIGPTSPSPTASPLNLVAGMMQ